MHGREPVGKRSSVIMMTSSSSNRKTFVRHELLSSVRTFKNRFVKEGSNNSDSLYATLMQCFGVQEWLRTSQFLFQTVSPSSWRSDNQAIELLSFLMSGSPVYKIAKQTSGVRSLATGTIICPPSIDASDDAFRFLLCAHSEDFVRGMLMIDPMVLCHGRFSKKKSRCLSEDENTTTEWSTNRWSADPPGKQSQNLHAAGRKRKHTLDVWSSLLTARTSVAKRRKELRKQQLAIPMAESSAKALKKALKKSLKIFSFFFLLNKFQQHSSEVVQNLRDLGGAAAS